MAFFYYKLLCLEDCYKCRQHIALNLEKPLGK